MYTNPPTDLVVVFLSLTVLSMDFFFSSFKISGCCDSLKKRKGSNVQKVPDSSERKELSAAQLLSFHPLHLLSCPPHQRWFILESLHHLCFCSRQFWHRNSSDHQVFLSLSLLPIIIHSTTLFPFSSFDHIVFSFFYFLCYFSTYLVPVAFGPQ